MEKLKRYAIGADGPVEQLVADGVSLALSRTGSGLVLLCLHATGHGGGDFAALKEQLDQVPIEVVTVDWPGQGRSEQDQPKIGRAHV